MIMFWFVVVEAHLIPLKVPKFHAFQNLPNKEICYKEICHSGPLVTVCHSPALIAGSPFIK